MLKVHRFIVNNFGENTYILVDEASRDAAIVDPGMQSTQDIDAVFRFIADHGLHLTQIINTHLHLDHMFGIEAIKAKYNTPLAAHKDDEFLAQTFNDQCRRFGMKCTADIAIDRYIADNDTINIGESQLQVIHVPGHSPGGIALYYAPGNFVIVGDSLFEGSIGRTDLPGGDFNTLIKSINNRLLTLPPDTVVLPGHGSPTTIRAEKQYNPFLR